MKLLILLIIFPVNVFANQFLMQKTAVTAEENKHYEQRISPVFDTRAYSAFLIPNQNLKIDVIFSYTCHACQSLEKELDKWLKKTSLKANYNLHPFIVDDLTEQHAYLYFVAKKLGILDRTHEASFKLISDLLQKQQYTFDPIKDAYPFLMSYGVSKREIISAYSSYEVRSEIDEAKKITELRTSNFLPIILIGKRYTIKLESIESFDHLFNVTEYLMKKKTIWYMPVN